MALLGAGALVAISGLTPAEYLAEVEWPTLVFFMGLFVMVGALVEVGVIGDIATWATDAVGDHYFLASTVLVFGSGALSGLVDNIPYVATMAPLVRTSSQAGDGSARRHLRVVGARPRRRPRRQRHRRRRQRQRRRARHRRPQRSPDLVLAVHQVRPRRRLRDGLLSWLYVGLRYFALA